MHLRSEPVFLAAFRGVISVWPESSSAFASAQIRDERVFPPYQSSRICFRIPHPSMRAAPVAPLPPARHPRFHRCRSEYRFPPPPALVSGAQTPSPRKSRRPAWKPRSAQRVYRVAISVHPSQFGDRKGIQASSLLAHAGATATCAMFVGGGKRAGVAKAAFPASHVAEERISLEKKARHHTVAGLHNKGVRHWDDATSVYRASAEF
jgi:hypothetical protein